MNPDEARDLPQSILREGWEGKRRSWMRLPRANQSKIFLHSSRALTREDHMVTRISQLIESVKEAITCVLILGMLSIIWPVIIVCIMGAFLFLYSWSAEEEFVVLFWPKVGNFYHLYSSLFGNSVF
jgi:hypothetical protein